MFIDPLLKHISDVPFRLFSLSIKLIRFDIELSEYENKKSKFIRNFWMKNGPVLSNFDGCYILYVIAILTLFKIVYNIRRILMNFS